MTPTVPTIQFPGEPITFCTPSWSDMQALSFAISQDILRSDQKIDRIVTLAKGGWPMTRSLVDFLQIEHVASIGVKFYKGMNERLDEPEIYQDLPVSVAGESVLLFDDVADTGESLIFVKEHLQNAGVTNVITAALFYKPHSHLKPDFYGAETSDWIIFPYDVVESIGVLGKKWRGKGLPEDEIRNRYTQLGFSLEQIEYYETM